MNRKRLLLLDRTIGRLLFALAVAFSRRRLLDAAAIVLPQGSPPRFIVIRPGGLGDGIMAIPFLRSLRNAFPKCHISIVCVGKNRSIFDLLPYHDELLVLGELSNTLSLLWRLHRMQADVLFDLEPYRKTSTIVAWWSSARARVGFDTNSRRRLYTHLVTYAEDSCSEPENMLRQLSVVGHTNLSEQAKNTLIAVSAVERKRIEPRIAAAGLDPAKHFIVAVAPGVLKPENQWVMSELAALIESILAEDSRTQVVLLGSQADLDNADAVLGHMASTRRVSNFVGKTTIVESLAILAVCRILVSGDGGLVHLASAAGCRTVSLWGPSVMARFKPVGSMHTGVKATYPCIPCVTRDRLGQYPGCPYDRRCLNDLRATQVMEAYLLQKRQSEGKASHVASNNLP